jgi:hypothetical protein
MTRAALALVPACFVLLPTVALAQPEAPPAEPEPAPPPPAAAAPAPAEPPGQPPPQYYVEPSGPPPARTAPAGPPGPPPGAVYEPPPPGYYPTVYEPPPPPVPKHVAPKYSLWLGARVGWFIPFGDLWASQDPVNTNSYEPVSWSEYASSGPMFELDIGARLGRHYNVFFAWERAALGTGSELPDAYGGQKTGETDFYAIGLRVSSDADKVGFLTEINLGYRRFRARWNDGTELHMTEAPLEFRLGLGADIRLGPIFSLSPLVTLGVGSFGAAEWQLPNGDTQDATKSGDQAAGHGWVTFQIGGHFDIAGGG